MNALSEFFANGQNRREWLDRKANALSDAAAYYLGPTGIPQKINALAGLAQYTDAGDMVEAADASRALWNDPTIANFGRYGTAAAAMMLPAVTARAINDGVDVAGDLARFGADESGAIRVWHGSPHDFDRFSMDKIGTGEGAQAYGHGLYFAESEDVARSYRDKLGGILDQKRVTVDGKEVALTDATERRALATLASDGLKNTRATIRNIADNPFSDPSDVAKWRRIVREYGGRDLKAENVGRLYEVDINADPDDFLDWDRPLSEQPQIAQRLGVDPNANMRRAEEIRARVAEDMRLDGRTTPDEIDQRNLDLAVELELLSATGDASSYAPRSMQMIEELKTKGIPGIRYLDAGSRGADGTGTRNYVVFDENLVQIVKKYGIAGAAAVLGLSQAEVAQAMEQRQPVAQTPPRLD